MNRSLGNSGTWHTAAVSVSHAALHHGGAGTTPSRDKRPPRRPRCHIRPAAQCAPHPSAVPTRRRRNWIRRARAKSKSNTACRRRTRVPGRRSAARACAKQIGIHVTIDTHHSWSRNAQFTNLILPITLCAIYGTQTVPLVMIHVTLPCERCECVVWGHRHVGALHRCAWPAQRRQYLCTGVSTWER